MQRPYEQYESLLHDLIANIREAGRDIKNLKCGRSNRLPGSSGVSHQVDVSFEDHSFDQPTLVLVECKLLGRGKAVSVNVPKILKYNAIDLLSQRKADLPLSHLLIVSNVRFTEPARKICRHEKILMCRVNDTPPIGFSYLDTTQIVLAECISTKDVAEVAMTPL